MPFTDTELATAMCSALVSSGLVTSNQLPTLLTDSTENMVRETLTQTQITLFPLYWESVRLWLQTHGGDIATTSGNSVPGRTGGKPSGLTAKPLYNDAFRDVTKFMTDGLKVTKAVSNQLRFVRAMGNMDPEDEGDDDD